MKLTLLLILAVVTTAVAQTNKPTFIKGGLEIKYPTRTQVESNGKPKPGVSDNYLLNLNVSDSALFRGTITHTPAISGLIGITQPSALNYIIECDVVNPANPAQTKNIGRLSGMVPIDTQGVYRFADGTLNMSVYATGRSQGLESKFSGLAAGKPPQKSVGFVEFLKKEAIQVKKQVQGKIVTVIVKKYDKMTFSNHTLAAGPVSIYPEIQINGEMLYDYARYAWYFQNVTLSYVVDGRTATDKLTGNIRWVESPQRKTDGKGEYQFDVRVNEPPPNESAVFATASDENSFFQTDDAVAALVGTMKYKDTLSGDVVSSSSVTVDLQGQKLGRQQTMNLCKLLLLSAIVPLNAE